MIYTDDGSALMIAEGTAPTDPPNLPSLLAQSIVSTYDLTSTVPNAFLLTNGTQTDALYPTLDATFSTNLGNVNLSLASDDAGIIGTFTTTLGDPAAIVATPEPSSLVLLGTGLEGMAVWAKRRRTA